MQPPGQVHPRESMPVGSIATFCRTVRLRGRSGVTLYIDAGTRVRILDYPALRDCGKVAMPGYCYCEVLPPLPASITLHPEYREHLWCDSANLRPAPSRPAHGGA